MTAVVDTVANQPTPTPSPPPDPETASDVSPLLGLGLGDEIEQTPKDWLEFLGEWIIDLVSLAETLFTTVYFDQDKFGFSVLLLVFTLFPIADSIAKGIATCTDTSWDEYAIDLISEGIEALLFLYYCSFSELSMIWIPRFAAIQVFLKFVIYFREWRNKKPGPLSDDDRNMNTLKGYIESVIGIFYAVSGCVQALLLLFWQDNSPFRTQHYEITVAVYTWIAVTFPTYGKINQFASNVYGIYFSYLCWSWWFSPDITQTFDKVSVMLVMIGNVVSLPFLCCMGCMACMTYRLRNQIVQ